ncbi:uncharacterized protein [Watersipora subatra]|uniref:uncharacterized protein n=1 Tax=Watersipora subatra TaxID=2589382 RepID=UPI00355AD14F
MYLRQLTPILLVFGGSMLFLITLSGEFDRSGFAENPQLLRIEAETPLTPSAAATDEMWMPEEQDQPLPDGEFPSRLMLPGLVFNNATKISTVYPEEFETGITITVVKSLSAKVEEHVKQIFNDEYGECKFHATLPAMVKRDGGVELIIRIWLSQYEKMSTRYKLAGKNLTNMVYEWRNTWQENYLYSLQMDEDYNPLKTGSIMGLPTTTNAAFTYKSDGPMDPRLFSVGNSTYLSFHTWLVDPTFNNQISGRLHLYDMDRHIKKKLTLNTKLLRTEINWIPLDIDGELYYTYSLDPLRVMKCDRETAACKFIYKQEGSAANPFVYTSDHLRGGTPWVLYKYPYYISVGHNVLVTTSPRLDYSLYNSNILVLSVKPWRLVYASSNIFYNQTWIRRLPIIRNQTILTGFFYPSGLIKRSDDVLDVSGHVNDAAGYIVRVRGIRQLMEKVISRDQENVAQLSPAVRTAQQYIMQSGRNWFPKWKFRGDIIAGTVEKPY